MGDCQHTFLLEMSALGMLLLGLAACSGGSSEPDPMVPPMNPAKVFREVTAQNLPAGQLSGLSMDTKFGDLDGDGDLDMVVAVEFSPNLVLLNNGAGVFTRHSGLGQGDHEDVGLADFDGDGDLDLVIAEEDTARSELYFNDGRANFTDAGPGFPASGISNAVLTNDIDGDGDTDLLFGNNGVNRIFVNDGSGGFTTGGSGRLPSIGGITQDLELGDADGDGDLDLLEANEGNNRLLLNRGDGFFEIAAENRLPLRASGEETREADFGDVDGDGDLDIFFANTAFSNPASDRQNRLLINDGNGFFSDETQTRLPSDNDLTVDGDFIDCDGDGDLDLVTANLGNTAGSPANTPYRVYRNDGNGVFAIATSLFFPDGITGNGFDIEAGDLNADSRIDLMLISRGGSDRLLLNTGNPPAGN